MLLALESGLLPYNYFPEVQAVKTACYEIQRDIEKKKHKKKEKEIDVEKILKSLAEI
jgi:hypothetical protein